MPRLRNPHGVVVVVDDDTAAALSGFVDAAAKAETKPKTATKSAADTKK